jgi:hypothetical protein
LAAEILASRRTADFAVNRGTIHPAYSSSSVK